MTRASSRAVKILLDGNYDAKITYALNEMVLAFESQGEVVLINTGEPDLLAGTSAGSVEIRHMVEAGELPLKTEPESLAIGRIGDTLVLAGSDAQGLMYALLEVADQVAVEGKSFDQIDPISESPDTQFRGLYTFLHNQDCERDWFYSRDHWENYFDLLARSRYNSFQIVMAHQTSYLAPPFPFFVDVPEHPEVRVPELSAEARDKNLAALTMICNLAAERGLEFVLGIWEVITWRAETDFAGHTQPSMVDGLDWDNLESYTYLASRRLLEQCPGIKGIQLRVNQESGIPLAKQTEFYTRTLFRAIKENGQGVFLDLRGWLARPQTIRAAMDMGISMRLSFKYWAEHLGAPYQAAQQEAAYSYADFLRYPHECPVSYQVWALGSHRHFVWGDPEYVRTFCQSLKLGDAIGFEICPPMAQKGYGNEPGSWRMLHQDYEHYQWEWERYWLYHLLFGRLTYNAEAAERVWMRHMHLRFGDRADAVMDAYRCSSKVVSLIIRFNMSDPNMYIWPEADTGGLLDYYIAALPSDPACIQSFSDAATQQIHGGYDARIAPRRVSEHLNRLGQECIAAANGLRVYDEAKSELVATLIDIEALGELALYHAEKILAAEQLALFNECGDYGALCRAADLLPRATLHWERLAQITDGVYTDRQVTGPIDSGHWKDKLVLVREDEERLSRAVELYKQYGGAVRAFDFGGRPEIAPLYSAISSMDDYHVQRRFVGVDDEARWNPQRTYGWVGDGIITSVAAPLVRFCDTHLDSISRASMRPTGWEKLKPYRDELYMDYVGGHEPATFVAIVPAGRYEVIAIFNDMSEHPQQHGPFSIKINGDIVARNIEVGVGEHREVRGLYDLGRARLDLTFEPSPGAEWFITGLVIRPVAPDIRHVPPRVGIAGHDLTLRVSVSCPDRMVGVNLCQDADGTTAKTPMRVVETDRLYETTTSAKDVPLSGQLNYWFEAESTSGLTSRLPEISERRTDFSLVCVDSDASPPEVVHEPVITAPPGQNIEIEAEVNTTRPLRIVKLHYRYTNQYYEWQVIEMHDSGNGFTATIPGQYIVPEWDLMYYLEAIDAGMATLMPESDPFGGIPYWVIKVDR